MKIEIQDVRCALTLLNVILILCHGVSFAWFGLAIAVGGLIKDVMTDRQLNGFLMHGANALMYLILIFK